MPEFIFRASDHSYWLDGRQIPALSDLLRPLTESKYQDIPDQFNLEERRERGVEIHHDIEAFCRGEVDRYVSPAVEAFAQWCDDSGFKPWKIEEPTYHASLHYGCTPDLLGTLKDGTYLLVDIKTGSKAAWHPVQLGGQSAALGSHGVVARDVMQGNLYLLPKWKKAPYDWCISREPEVAQGLALTYAYQQKYEPRFGLKRHWFTEKDYE